MATIEINGSSRKEEEDGAIQAEEAMIQVIIKRIKALFPLKKREESTTTRESLLDDVESSASSSTFVSPSARASTGKNAAENSELLLLPSSSSSTNNNNSDNNNNNANKMLFDVRISGTNLGGQQINSTSTSNSNQNSSSLLVGASGTPLDELDIDAETLVMLCYSPRSVAYIVQQILRLMQEMTIDDGTDLTAAHQDQVYTDKFLLQLLRRCLHRFRRSEKQKRHVPNLQGSVVESLFTALLHLYMTSSGGFMHNELQRLAQEVIYELSCLNFGSVFSCLSRRLELQRGDPDLPALAAIAYLHLDFLRLRALLSNLAQHVSKFRKPVLKKLAPPLREAIWRWIDANPTEFHNLWREGENGLTSAPVVIFQAFEKLATKNKRKFLLWPCEVALMLLAPSTMSEAVFGQKSGGGGNHAGSEHNSPGPNNNNNNNLHPLEEETAKGSSSSSNNSSQQRSGGLFSRFGNNATSSSATAPANSGSGAQSSSSTSGATTTGGGGVSSPAPASSSTSHHRTSLVGAAVNAVLSVTAPEDPYLTMGKFLNKLREALVGKVLTDLACGCLVDFCKAATLLEPPMRNASLAVLSPVLFDLRTILIHPQNPYSPAAAKADLPVQFMRFLLLIQPGITSGEALASALRHADVGSAFLRVFARVMKQMTREHSSVPYALVGMERSELALHVRSVFARCRQPGVQAACGAGGLPIPAGRSSIRKDSVSHATMDQEQQKMSYSCSTLSALLKTLRNAPELVYLKEEDDSSIKYANEILQSVIEIISETSGVCDFVPTARKLFKNALATMAVLCRPSSMNYWPASIRDRGFWLVTTVVMVRLSELVMRKHLSGSILYACVDLLVDVCCSGKDFLASRDRSAHDKLDAAVMQQRADALSNLETSMLVLLCTGSMQLLSRVATLVRVVYEQLELLGPLEREDHTIDENLDFYLCIGGQSQLGPMRRDFVRGKFRLLTVRTAALVDAWNKVFGRWKHFQSLWQESGGSEASLAGHSDAAMTTWNIEWDNYTAFLCSLAYVCYPSGVHASPTTATVDRLSGLLGSKPRAEGVTGSATPSSSPLPGVLPPSLATPGAATPSASALSPSSPNHHFGNFALASSVLTPMLGPTVLDMFILDCLRMLSCSGKHVRLMVRTNLATHLSPEMHFVLLSHMVSSNRIGGGDVKKIVPSEEGTYFVEQAVAVAKVVLMTTAEPFEGKTARKYEQLVFCCMDYASKLDDDSQDAVFIRRKLAALTEQITTHRELLAPGRAASDHTFEAQLLRIFAEWAARSQAVNSSSASSHEGTDVFCLQAVCRLLQILPVQALRGAGAAEEQTARANLFTKYFNFVAGALTRILRERELRKDDTRSASVSLQLESLAVRGLSHLLHYNTEVGLDMVVRYCLHSDSRLRQSFLQILQRFLQQQGLASDSSAIQKVNEEVKAVSEGYRKLFALLSEEGLDLVFALCDTIDLADADSIASIVLNHFHAQGRGLELVASCATREIMKTQFGATLFRSNSMTSRFMKIFSQVNANQYLMNVLKPIVQRVICLPRPQDLELDPRRIDEDGASVASTGSKGQGSIEARSALLTEEVRMALERIVMNASSCPRPLRLLCLHLRSMVANRHPGFENLALGGFLFLRFFCPALVAPEGHGLISEPPNEGARRLLILIAKTLQNLASGVCTFKESYMSGLEPFLAGNQPKLLAYYDVICNVDIDEKEAQWVASTPGTGVMDGADSLQPLENGESSSDQVRKTTVTNLRRSAGNNSGTNSLRASYNNNNDPPSMLRASSGSNGSVTGGNLAASINIVFGGEDEEAATTTTTSDDRKESFMATPGVEDGDDDKNGARNNRRESSSSSSSESEDESREESNNGEDASSAHFIVRLRKAKQSTDEAVENSESERRDSGGALVSSTGKLCIVPPCVSEDEDDNSDGFENSSNNKERRKKKKGSKQDEKTGGDEKKITKPTSSEADKDKLDACKIISVSVISSLRRSGGSAGAAVPLSPRAAALATPSSAASSAAAAALSFAAPVVNVSVEHAQRLHSYLANHLEDIERSLAGSSSAVAPRFVELLEKLGPAPVLSAIKGVRAHGDGGGNSSVGEEGGSWEAFTAFMNKHASLSTQAIDEKMAFYWQGRTLKGRPVFYIIARRFEHIEADSDLLLYAFLKQLTVNFRAPFEVVVDCCFYSPGVIVFPFQQLFRLLPPVARGNTKRVIAVMPSPAIKAALDRPEVKLALLRMQLPRGWRQHIIPISSPSDLKSRIPEKDVGLPPATMELENDVQTTFPHIRNARSEDVVFKFGSNNLQILSTTGSLFGHSTPLTTIIPIASLRVTTLRADKIQLQYPERTATGATIAKTAEFKTSQANEIFRAFENIRAMLRADATPAVRIVQSSDLAINVANMGFINMVHSDASVRWAAFNLLCQLNASLGYLRSLPPLSQGEVCLPPNLHHLVLRLSAEFARAEPHLTLDFLMVALQNFNVLDRESKHACVDFLTPWLQNLSDFPAESVSDKKRLRSWLEFAAELTVLEGQSCKVGSREPASDLYYALLRRVWPLVFASPKACPVLLEALFSRMRSVNEATALALTDIIVLLSSTQPEFACSAVIRHITTFTDEMLKALPRDAPDSEGGCVATGAGSKIQMSAEGIRFVWDQLLIFAHILNMISFDNIVLAQNYLADVIHTALLLVPFGSPSMRASMYSVLINIFSSLRNRMGNAALEPVLKRLSKKEFQLVFLGTSSLYSAPLHRLQLPPVEGSGDYAGTAQWSDLLPKNVVQMITEVILRAMDDAAVALPDMGSKWREDLEFLCLQSCFSSVSPLRARCFVVFGCITRCTSASDPAMLNLLVALKHAMCVESPTHCREVVVSIFFALARMCAQTIDSDPSLTIHIIWLAIALLQLGDEECFGLGLKVFLSQLAAPAMCNVEGSIESNLINVREASPALGTTITSIEQLSKISFGPKSPIRCAFALVFSVAKGLAHSSTKTNAKQLLLHLLDAALASEYEEGNEKGAAAVYLLGGWPFFSAVELADRLSHFGSDDHEGEQVIIGLRKPGVAVVFSDACAFIVKVLTRNKFFTAETGNLLGGLLLCYVHNIRSSQENLRLYGLLSMCIQQHPTLFQPHLLALAKKMTSGYGESHEPAVGIALRNALQVVLHAASSLQPTQPPPSLAFIGFEALTKPNAIMFSHFQSAHSLQLWNTVSQVVEVVVGAIADQIPSDSTTAAAAMADGNEAEKEQEQPAEVSSS